MVAVLVAEEHQVAGKNWIHKFITPLEVESVSKAVALAEQTTAGEIVTVIVRRSSYVGHVQAFGTLLLLLIFLFLEGFEFIKYEFSLHFSNQLALIGPHLVLLVLVAIFWLAASSLKEVQWIQRILIPLKDQQEQVEKRALLEYYLNHVTQTEKKTGILIFISLMERKTVVLADESISEKLSPETWTGIVDIIVEGVKNKKTAEGLIHAIANCGKILAEHVPTYSGNQNELANHLIIKD